MTRNFKKSIKNTVVSLLTVFHGDKIERELLRKRWKSLGVESSNICNAQCSFCAYRKGFDSREKGFASFEVLRHTLDLYDKSGGGNFSFSSILGDPLTDKNFLEKVKLARNYNSIKCISIYTNLIGLNNFKISDFITSGLTEVIISTAIGDAGMFERLYGVPLYEKVMDNLLALMKSNRAAGNPLNVTLSLRVDYDFLSKLKYVPVYKELKNFLKAKDIKVLGKKEWDDYNGMIELSDLPKGAGFKPNPKTKKMPCYGLFRKIQILKNGDISVCSCRVSPELVVDNIFNYSSLEDYWRGEKLDSFRKQWTAGNVPSICKSCNHYIPYTCIIKNMMRERTFGKKRR